MSFTAMQRRSAARDSSPNAHACRSRRGEAPEGSPVFSPDGRLRERRARERYTTPPGCRTDRLTGKCDTLTGSLGRGISALRPARGRGDRGWSRHIGHRFADDRCLWSEHPSGATRMSPPWYMMTLMPKCLTPCILSDESDRSKNNRWCTPSGVPSS